MRAGITCWGNFPRFCRRNSRQNISILIRYHPVLCVETGDILTVAGGLFIVLIIALIANPQYLAGLQVSLPGSPPAPTQTLPPPTTIPPLLTTATATPTPAQTPPASPTPALPHRIHYTDKPFTYPVVRLPDRLEMFGESDVRRTGQDIVTFAFMEDSRGGISRVFSIPYPVWTMDIRVIDNTTPNIASFRMALCYAANGTVIEGVELMHPGTAYKKIQTSNIPLYLIISTTNIEGYRIDMQTSREYFEQFGMQQYETPVK